MDPLEIMLMHGARFWAAGNNGTVLMLEHDRFKRAGIDPETVCTAFNQHRRIALKIIHKSAAKGIAEEERLLQVLAVSLLEKMGTERLVRIPRILSDRTTGYLLDPMPLIYMTGVRPVNGHVEYLLMEWVDGFDFATLLYRIALENGLQRSLAMYNEEQMLYELQIIMNVFLEEYILKYSDRLDVMELDVARAYRIGGQLRAEIHGGRTPLHLWNKFLPEAKALALEAFRCHAIIEALDGLLKRNAAPAKALIAAENDTVLLERAIKTAFATQLLDYIKVDTTSGRREGFYDMIGAWVGGVFMLPGEMFENLRSALVFLNNQQYHHNDLHERNIMIGNNRKDLFIIDVATATHQQQKESSDISIVAPSSLFYTVTHP
jgi:hypothetical protein